MIQEPVISIPVFGGGRSMRRQFLTTLSLKVLCQLLSPILECKDQGAGFRADPLAAKKIVNHWRGRGEIKATTPIVVAIRSDCCFVPYETGLNYGLGTLECPLNAILDVCDGIQRLAAIKMAQKANDELLRNEWPVHLIETHGFEDLAHVTEMIRKQTTIHLGRLRMQKSSPDAEKWGLSVIGKSKFLQKAVAATKSSLAPRSSNLWTGSSVYNIFARILCNGLVEPTDETAESFARLWDQIPCYVDVLLAYQENRLPASRLREETVLPLAPAFYGMSVAVALSLHPDVPSPDAVLRRLGDIDWTHGGGWPTTPSRRERAAAWAAKVLASCGVNRILKTQQTL